MSATAFVTERVVSQDVREELEKQDPQREEWLRLAAPGPEHERLSRWSGTWRQEQTYWMYPGAAAHTSAATAKFKPIFGGRFLREQVKGRDKVGGGGRFVGYGFFGYDNYTEQHVFWWIDNQGTMMLTGAGVRDDTGAITYHSAVPNPVTGGTTEIRSIARQPSSDTLLFEMHERQPDGTWFQKVAVVATREP